MDWKLAISVGSAVVGAFSAYQAYSASERAAELSENRFATESIVNMLKLAHDEVEKSRSKDEHAQRAACIFVTRLVSVESDYVRVRQKSSDNLLQPTELQNSSQQRDGILSAYFSSLLSEGFVHPTCRQYAAEKAQLAEFQITPEGLATEQERTPPQEQELGRWQAVIASYDITAQGCEFAKRNVDEFSESLSSGFDFPPLNLYIATTRISNNYAVTVDSGNDRQLAQNVSAAVRRIGSNRRDKDGADSFVQENKGWYISPECSYQKEISG